MALFAGRYTWLLYKKDENINPALSMWIIFFIGGFTSLASYAVSEKKDFLSGIQNTVDVCVIVVLIVSILLWGKREVRFQPFERKYLAFAGLIFLFWAISKSAFYSNILTQILMTWGYFPSIQNMVEKKKNTESFLGWSLVQIAQVFGLFPAFIEGNLLACIYVIRAIVMTGILLGVMTFFHFRKK